MPKITVTVEPEDPELFRVRLVEDRYVRVHHVWVRRPVLDLLGQGAPAPVVVETAVRAILERDPEARLPARVELSELADQNPFIADELRRRLGEPPPERPGPPEVA